MKITLKDLMQLKEIPMDTEIANELMRLNEYVILSNEKYNHRYNILDKGQNKIALGHIIILGKKIYFSERPTTNAQVKKHPISLYIYIKLTGGIIRNIDRDAKPINKENAIIIVNEILKVVNEKN